MQTSGNTPADSLGEEIAAGKLLLQLLRQEQENLVQADIEAMSSLTEEKMRTVARMTELAQRRYRALAAAGHEANEAGMQNWIKNPAAAAAGNAWNELLTLAQQAKELNRTNGLLIGQHLTRNQMALNVLQGNQQGGAMYGPDGQAATKSGSRKLVVG